MKKAIYFIAFLSLYTLTTQAQVAQITSGAGYKKQTFYKLSTEASSTVDNTSWDIAFTVYGQQDAGIFLNESASTGNPIQNPLKLYKAPTNTFTDVFTVAALKDSLLNDEKSWSFGAFNADSNPAAFDYGWGAYDPVTHQIKGKKVFVLKLRDGNYRKIEIQNLVAAYTFRHANLDGTDEKTVSVDKTKFVGKTLAYYNFSTNAVVDLEPAGGFDLLYTRYVTTVDQNGISTPYPVLGILTGRGATAVKATGVDPSKVSFDDYKNKLETRTDVIGYDWKTFALTTMTWSVPTDVAYFVKTKDNDVYKIVFIDFEGSATGTATFERISLGKFTASKDLGNEVSVKVFPTLVNNEINVAFDNKINTGFEVIITNINGQMMQKTNLGNVNGFQVNTIDVANLTAGTYVLTLKTNTGITSTKFVKQ